MTVKKLVSLNPDKYEDMDIEVAKVRYIDYVQSCIKSQFEKNRIPKTWQEWLDTEI